MSEQPNLVATMSYEERCVYYREHFDWPAKSTNADYLQYEALFHHFGYHSYDTVQEVVSASYEYLAGLDGRKVELEEVLRLVSQPWRTLLVQLESYAPVAPRLVYFQILAAWQSNPDETGAHARGVVDIAKGLLTECVAFLDEEAQLYLLASEQARLDLDRQQLAAASAESSRKRARQEAITDTIIWLVTFGLGIGVGWLLAQLRG